ncbi:hypothetical protein BC828DRAFT_373842 [Blastocladiella britannica]|nr:hypothetical protein BC828DRAFT_373842 [Blastocladiella britannica]
MPTTPPIRSTLQAVGRVLADLSSRRGHAEKRVYLATDPTALAHLPLLRFVTDPRVTFGVTRATAARALAASCTPVTIGETTSNTDPATTVTTAENNTPASLTQLLVELREGKKWSSILARDAMLQRVSRSLGPAEAETLVRILDRNLKVGVGPALWRTIMLMPEHVRELETEYGLAMVTGVLPVEPKKGKGLPSPPSRTLEEEPPGQQQLQPRRDASSIGNVADPAAATSSSESILEEEEEEDEEFDEDNHPYYANMAKEPEIEFLPEDATPSTATLADVLAQWPGAALGKPWDFKLEETADYFVSRKLDGVRMLAVLSRLPDKSISVTCLSRTGKPLTPPLDVVVSLRELVPRLPGVTIVLDGEMCIPGKLDPEKEREIVAEEKAREEHERNHPPKGDNFEAVVSRLRTKQQAAHASPYDQYMRYYVFDALTIDEFAERISGRTLSDRLARFAARHVPRKFISFEEVFATRAGVMGPLYYEKRNSRLRREGKDHNYDEDPPEAKEPWRPRTHEQDVEDWERGRGELAPVINVLEEDPTVMLTDDELDDALADRVLVTELRPDNYYVAMPEAPAVRLLAHRVLPSSKISTTLAESMSKSPRDRWVTDERAEELQTMMVEARRCGWEGLVVRRNTFYNGKRSRDIAKLKKFHDAEYTVVGLDIDPEMRLARGMLPPDFLDLENDPVVFVKPDFDLEVDDITVLDAHRQLAAIDFTKDAHPFDLVVRPYVRAVLIEHRGKRVAVGSGLSMADRLGWALDPSLVVGKIATVQYFEETKDGSLRFPSLKAVLGDVRDM